MLPGASWSLQLHRASFALSPRTKARSLGSGDAYDGDVPRRGVPMPNGTWWLPERRVPGPVYGDNFVIQRREPGERPPEGLVVRVEGDATIQPWAPPVEMGLVLIGQTIFHTALAVYRGGLPPEVVETDCSEVEEERAGVGSACLAMVRRDAPDDAGPAEAEEHPRRTGRVRFTCDRCGRVNVKAFNPLAWNYGAVLCRCEGCAVVHLLRDEKGVFGVPRSPKKTIPAGNLLGRLDPSIVRDRTWRSGGFELFDL